MSPVVSQSASDDVSKKSKRKFNKKARATELADMYGITTTYTRRKQLLQAELDEKEKKTHFEALDEFNKSYLKSAGLSLSFTERFFKFWRIFPTRIWNFYIEALVIPGYRKEWGKYNTWLYNSLDRSLLSNEERRARTKMSRRKRLVSHMKVAGGPNIGHNHSECERVTINVSGRRFQTQVRTLKRLPETLLGDPVRRLRYYDPVKDEYFFDRHRTSFEAILYFYQSNDLIRPSHIPIKLFEDEIRFFGLGDDVINKYREEEGLILENDKPVPKNLLQRKLWLLIEYPESSKNARLVSILSIAVIVISILVFCMETVPEFRLSGDDGMDRLDLADPFFLVETVCIIWFCTEIIVRIAVCPNKTNFITDFMNIVDFVAILPYFSTLIAVSLGTEGAADGNNDNVGARTALLGVLRVIRLVRVFRIFKLSRHSKGLKILGRTLHASLRELALLFFFLLIAIVLFSSAIYFFELGQTPNKYSSIPASFWWAVITLTTVGYGDVVPIGVAGKIIGAACAVTGVLTVALPVPVIVSNFNYFYHREKDNEFSTDAENSSHVQECPFRPTCGCGKRMMPDNSEVEYPAKYEEYQNRRRSSARGGSVPSQQSGGSGGSGGSRRSTKGSLKARHSVPTVRTLSERKK